MTNYKKRASYLHILGQLKQEHMGRKRAVCEQYGRWKPWLHLHQTAPVSVSPTSCRSLSPGSQQSHVLTTGQHYFFFFYPSHRLTADPSDPVVGDFDWLLCSKPRPPPLLQPRGATAALNSQNPVCACVCAYLYTRELIFYFFILTICHKLEFA